MPDIFVQRDDGLQRGPDIIDPLLTTVEACIARGRCALDEQAQPSQEVELEIVYRTGLRLGMLVTVSDLLSGRTYYGKITGIGHDATTNNSGAVETVTRITLFRPTAI